MEEIKGIFTGLKFVEDNLLPFQRKKPSNMTN